MAKLVAIGDSITQGVMSAAISKTKLSYPALIADAMGLNVWEPGDDGDPKDPNGFRVPHFPGSGFPFNIEEFLKALGPDFDASKDIRRLIRRIWHILKFIDETEDSQSFDEVSYDGVYHNLAVLSFRVFHSFTVNAASYNEQITDSQDNQFFDTIIRELTESIISNLNDEWRQRPSVLVDRFLNRYLDNLPDIDEGPSEMMYRVARHVLNPSQNSDRKRWTQICNLKHIMDQEGVENLILFLGANDCLGTVRDLEIRDMEGKNVDDDLEDRRQYNLTSEDVFRRDYKKMVCQISEIISEDTKVFVGTIPYVTIPPITQASKKKDCVHNGRQYFTRYDLFFEEESSRHLTGKKARHIDDRIDKFNEIIKDIIQTVPKKGNWCPVEIGCLLNKLAIRRASDNPCDDPDKPLKDLLPCDHELLSDDLAPIPNVLRLQTENNERKSGGIFSLDCFHPTTIGQGLIAREFVSEMKAAGVSHIDPKKSDWDLNWKTIIKNDTLLEDPPELWDEAVNLAEDHSGIASLIYRIFM